MRLAIVPVLLTLVFLANASRKQVGRALGKCERKCGTKPQCATSLLCTPKIRQYKICMKKCEGRVIESPTECHANEKYTECSQMCQETCEEKPNPCPAICASGCICDTGYIRANKTDHSYGPCIPKQECDGGNTTTGAYCKEVCEEWNEECLAGCKKGCGPNEKFVPCGETPCPATCKYKDGPPECFPQEVPGCCVSHEMCDMSGGCACQKGYVRNQRTGECVLPDHCPEQTPNTKEAHCKKVCKIWACKSLECQRQYKQCLVACKKDRTFPCDKPGAMVSVPWDCNKCECLADGSFGGCTEAGCGLEMCDKPGSTVPSPYDDCNECGCNAFGLIDICTKVGCDIEPCDQKFAVVGPCKAASPSFSYNKEKGKCEKFIYGGCDGNDNRFGSLAECEDECENGDNGGTVKD